jgi:ribosomal protein RSM22 (predicted rRNA methylase)
MRYSVPRSQGKSIYKNARKATWGISWPHAPLKPPVIHYHFGIKERKGSIHHKFTIDDVISGKAALKQYNQQSAIDNDEDEPIPEEMDFEKDEQDVDEDLGTEILHNGTL